jgi:hypothetical protein
MEVQPLRRLASLALMCGMLVACQSSHQAPAGQDGPLRALSMAGGKGVYLPGGSPRRWTESYGDVIVCNSQPVTITGVTVTKEIKPISVSVYVHPIPTTYHREFATLGSTRGRPGDHTGTWTEIAGRFLPLGPAGVPIRTKCEGKVGEIGIVVTMEVGRRGGMVMDPVISYTADGRQFTVETRWTYVACGRALIHSDWCKGDPRL